MQQHELILTPKNLYRLLTGSLTQVNMTKVLTDDRKSYATLVPFWWGFLSSLAPGEVLDPIFNASERRSRQLSNIMNRSAQPSLPLRLQNAMESSFTADHFRQMVRWMYRLLQPSVSPVRIHQVLNAFEDKCARDDMVFSTVYPFMVEQRPEHPRANTERARYHCAFRIAWLGLHAIWGNQMNSLVMKSFRRNEMLTEQAVWSVIVQTMSNREEVTQQAAISTVNFTPPQAGDELQEAAACLSEIMEAVPDQSSSFSFIGFSGWYTVANWTDPVIAINDSPRATYKGANLLGQIPNGAIIYVFMASGYHGLNLSACCWGYARYGDLTGYVPMNFLVKFIFPDGSAN